MFEVTIVVVLSAIILTLAKVFSCGVQAQAKRVRLEEREKIVKRAMYHWLCRDWKQAQRMIKSAGDLDELDLHFQMRLDIDRLMRRTS